jgi:proteasome lid subunit RPN8/RPN11
MKPTSEAIAAMKAHARAEYPRESVGALVFGQYVPLRNLSDHPERHVKGDLVELAKHSNSGGLECIVHSHPDGPQYPSRADMISQIRWGCAFGIVTLTKDLIDAPFFWGGKTRDRCTHPAAGSSSRMYSAMSWSNSKLSLMYSNTCRSVKIALILSLQMHHTIQIEYQKYPILF